VLTGENLLDYVGGIYTPQVYLIVWHWQGVLALVEPQGIKETGHDERCKMVPGNIEQGYFVVQRYEKVYFSIAG